MRSTAEKPWDRLCDQLNGRGVPNLDDALVNLELRPVHDALRLQLDPAIVRLFADLAEHPRGMAVAKDKRIERERSEFFEQAWLRCEEFLRAAQTAYVSRVVRENLHASVPQPTNPTLLGSAFRERLRAAMRIPAIEALFPAPWTVAARRVLPSPSPKFTATAMWGPLLGWCALELLAESIDVEQPERVALDLFDRLRLREPYAQAFVALGFEGEEGWRVAARIKVVLLTGAGVGKAEVAPVEVESDVAPAVIETPPETPADNVQETVAEAATEKTPEAAAATTDDEKVALSAALWLDPDVRWLCGVHEAGGHSYLIREQYEELLWWLLMPSLLRLAGETAPSRAAVLEMSKTVTEALTTAEAAGYRIDALLGSADASVSLEEAAAESEPEGDELEPLTGKLEPQEPTVESPEVSVPDPVGPA